MAKTLRSRQADRDLLEIWVYLAEQNLHAADRVIDLIKEKCDLLAQFPLMGRSRPELGDELRSFSAGSYVIYYLPVDDGITVARVYHASREDPTGFPRAS